MRTSETVAVLLKCPGLCSVYRTTRLPSLSYKPPLLGRAIKAAVIQSAVRKMK